MSLQAILFDLDDTLIIDETVSHNAFEKTGEKAAQICGANAQQLTSDAARIARELWAVGPAKPYCQSIGISAFECLWGNFLGDSSDLTTLREWSRVYRVNVFDQALRAQLIEAPDVAADLAGEFSSQRRQLQRLMPDAREILTRLQADYKIGLLTNGAPDLQREKLTASGLGEFFGAVAVSGEHGIGKPKPEIFHRLLDELTVSAGEALMVGNSLVRDIAGARNAGIQSAWIVVPGSEEPDAVEPDFVIHGLNELPVLAEKLHSKQ